MEPLAATFYGKLDQKNPVVLALEHELNDFRDFMEKAVSADAHTRGANDLFCIWNKYEKILPVHYFEEKLLMVGDFLVQLKLHKLASWQCYGRYLQQFGSFRIDDITDIDKFKTTFFVNGFEVDNSSFTFHALQMYSVCCYQVVKKVDPKLLNLESKKKCMSILKFLRLIMQVALPKEHLFWLIFNGTTHIYTICRHLMVLALYAQAFEYVLWASISMESSAPLLTVRFLSWRATLYTAVCQCYYDCESGILGETFARRALGKISELNHLEMMSSSSPSPEAMKIFREATIKVSVMIFKRAVFESRRKPKGILRPKMKTNYRETQNQPWPHNATEFLLVEMFNGSAAQFLAISETLSGGNRRILQTKPPVPAEQEILDVTMELFLAGLLLISGGGGNTQLSSAACTDPVGGIKPSSSLIELAANGEDGVSVEAVVRFAKAAFCFEYLDIFDTIIAPLLTLLRKHDNLAWKSFELDLDLLVAMEPFVSSRKSKHGLPTGENCAIGGSLQPSGATNLCDDLVILAERMFVYTCTPFQATVPDVDMVVDAFLFLWQKCKAVLQRDICKASGSIKYLKKVDGFEKWIHILYILQEVAHWCNIGHVDPVLMVDVVLYSAGALENLADSSMKSKKKSGILANRADTATSTQTPASIQTEYCGPTNLLMKNPSDQLAIACKMLEKAMDSIATARSAAISPDGSSLIDNNLLNELIHQSARESDPREQDEMQKGDSYGTRAIQSLIMDLHLELFQVYYRVAFKLFGINLEADIISKVKKNKVLKALFLIQKVISLHNKEEDYALQKSLFEEIVTLLQKAEAEEKKLYLLNTQKDSSDNKKLDVVPAPILVSRTHNSMIFKPAPFASSEKVYWYRIFGRSATGSILKARLKDIHLQGTGREVPAFEDCLLEVKGLEPNEKYIFAVAGYSKDGKIIGKGIGETTKPILAYHPLSILMTWTYLCKAAYQLGHYPVTKAAFSVLWDHFVSEAPSPAPDPWYTSNKTEWYITQKRLNNTAVPLASPILLRSFLGNIFIESDINCKEGAAFCDSVCDGGPLYKGQLSRLAKCEKMLVAIDLAGWINDGNQALQAVAQCYGLLAPMIFHRIPSVPVVQVLTKCLCVLQDVGAHRLRKQFGVTENVQHMIGCFTYYLAKVLQCWKEYDLAVEVAAIGKEILLSTLHVTTVESKALGNKEDVEPIQGLDNKLEEAIAGEKLAIQNTLEQQVKAMDEGLANLTKEVKAEELTESESSTALFIAVSFGPINTAHHKVMQLKGQDRFLEFFVLLMHRLIREENFKPVSRWADEVVAYIKRRNRSLLGIKKSEKKTTKLLKNTAVVVEYHNTPVHKKTRKDKVKLKELLDDFLNNPILKMDPSAQRKQKEKLEKKAREIFRTQLRPLVHNYLQRKRFHQFCINEMPWHSQLHKLLGIMHFNSFIKCYEEEGWTSKTISRYSFLDPDIFILHNSGALLVDTERGDSETVLEFQLYTERRKEEASEITSVDSISDSSESELSVSAAQEKEEPEHTAEEPGMPSSSTNFIINQLSKAFLHFRKAVVLAHRGGHWTALQNACRLLWNCAHIAMMYITGMDSAKEGVLNSDNVKLILCLPFNLAAQNLLDMILHLQNTNNYVKFIDPDGIFGVPGCVGPLSDDTGGFNLTFERQFDDVNVVDLHWVCAMVLYALELLCNQKKWESLVHLAIYFNIVTHERYTQKVTPLLVYAQRQLQTRIREHNGPTPPQPHFVKAALDSGKVINCRNFIEHQLTVATSVQPEGPVDPDQKDASSAIDVGGKRANALISVPVDVTDTLSCFRETLFNANYVSSALRHSRKLHALLLAYTQQRRKDILRHTPGKVGFSSTPTHIENSRPTDLSNEDFLLFADILSKPLPWSQVSLVILSYDNTIELLRANGQNSLCAQALHEQGNLHFYKARKRHAFRRWSQAIDVALNVTDFINNWQDMESSGISFKYSKDFSEALLHRAGIWGCLLAGILTAKIAQFITLSDFKFKIDCCILSSFFFKALFRTTLPHPRNDREYASYEIGFDCDVVELIPGIDLFSDRFRADIRTVVGSLNFVLHELHAARQNLLALPLFTLYQYFVSSICRDVQKSVEARILKMKALTDLGLFAEAFAEHHVLINGEKIPDLLLGGFRPSEPKVQMKFDQSNQLLTDNLQALEEVLKTPLSPALRTLYGPQLENKFELGRIHLIIKLAETINHIPESVTSQCPSTGEKESAAGGMIIDLDTEDVRVISHLSQIQGATQECHPSQEKSGLHKHLTLPQLKDVVLQGAQNKLNIFMETLKAAHDSEFANLPPAALEMVIDAKLQSAAIAFQRLQLAFSAAIALSALQLLQRARILTKHKLEHKTALGHKMDPAPALRSALKSTQHEDHINKDFHQETWNMEARGRLHMGLWLKCRLAMVTALTAQIYSAGLKKEGFLDTSQLCEEGVMEAKDYGDVETQAEFMLQEVLLDFQLGYVNDHIRTVLQNIVDLLNPRQFNSPSAVLILIKAMLQLTDLSTVEWICTVESAVRQEKMNVCLSAQKLILDQLVLLGETARHQSYGDIYSCLAVPLKNVYLPHIILMAKIKLRIGNAVAQLAACSAKRRSESTWQEALSTYSTGLQLCREAVSQEADLEADLLLQKGKVLRQLTEIRSGKSLEAANFLMEAINVSHFHGQNTWLIRQAYLELVLLYFHISEEDEKETENNLRQDQSDNKLSVKSGIILIPKQVKKKITGQGRLKEILQVVLKQPPKCKILAWIAIRAANQANCILHSSQKLTRDKSISDKHVANMVQNELHEYILLDILASHEDYQTENDELLPSLSTIQGEEVEEEKKEASETVEDPDIMAPYRKIAAKKLTSVHLLRYNDQLRRLYNISLLPVQSENENAVPLGCKTQSTEPQMHEDFWKYAMNSAREGVHTPVLNTGILQRLERMHLFLIHHLPAYNTYCCVESIPNILYELFDRSFRSPEFQPEIYTSVFGEYTLTTPETSYIGKITPQMSIAVQSTDKEFHVQWFLPPLGISSTSCETQKVLFLYAYNVKPITLISIKTSSLTNASCGYKWVYLKRLVLLHKKLSALRSKAEMYLQPELKSPSVQLSINRLRQRYTRTDSALNIRKLPTQTEEMVMSLCREIKEMFLPGSIIKPEAEVPFDITTETLEALEKIFNPSSGYVLNHGSLFTWLTSFIESD